jgi:hypothetical protein
MPSEPLKPWEPFATVVSPELGGAAPSAPTVDAHMIHGLERCIAAAHRLLDEHHDATVVDRQDAEDAARLLAVLRGAAPSAPTVDAHMIHGLERCIAAAHRLLDEHHDATVVDRQGAEDAARLLAVLRGGATAPTPDDPPTREDLNWCPGCGFDTLDVQGRCYVCAQASDHAHLRRDTGASHE